MPPRNFLNTAPFEFEIELLFRAGFSKKVSNRTQVCNTSGRGLGVQPPAIEKF